MRFSVDAHAIGRNLTGNEVYVKNLLQGFDYLDRESEFLAYLSEQIRLDTPEVPHRFGRRHVSSNGVARLGFQLNSHLRQDCPDLLHVQYTAPLRCPVPVVVSVHDVSFLEHPEYFPWQRRLQLRLTVRRTVERAAKVITPSQFSRRALLRHYQVDPGKVVVVPIAVSSMFRPTNRDAAAAQVRSRFSIQTPYILTVGDLQPRKNQVGLIRAFEKLIQSAPQLPHRLVIVGQKTWYADRVMTAARKSSVADRIIFPGFVPDAELISLYNGADVIAFPSFYEGFGLPVLEAMACGRAVVCSNTSALPEIANAAALLFDPHSVDDVARAMRDILLNPELRIRMERLGLHRASLFTWDRTARQTLDLYYEVAGASRAPVEAARTETYIRR